MWFLSEFSESGWLWMVFKEFPTRVCEFWCGHSFLSELALLFFIAIIPQTKAMYVHRYFFRFLIKSDVTRTQHINNNLKRLLSYCKDVVVRYKLAKSLDLKEVTNELLTMENGLVGAFIKDTLGVNHKAGKWLHWDLPTWVLSIYTKTDYQQYRGAYLFVFKSQ